MIKIIALLLAVGLLAGCEIAGQAITDVGDLQKDAREHVGERFDRRRAIRAECADLLNREVEVLKAENRFAEARELLEANYPPLMTEKALSAAINNDSAILAEIDVSGCAPVKAE